MAKTRILVVDDSVVARRVIADVLSAEEDLEVVGTAPNGLIALTKIERLAPDIVTLDIEMPELDGIETLTRIRAAHPKVRVIMVSNLTLRGAAVTVESLFLGASDYVTKAAKSSSQEEARRYLRSQLVPKVRALAGRGAAPRTSQARAAKVPVKRRKGLPRVKVIAIGASTGGPNALAAVLKALPKDFPVPILIVQHMPENFTLFLAQRLDAVAALTVREASAGEQVIRGGVWIAPGNLHLEAYTTKQGVEVATTSGPMVNSCRPSADVLFRTAVTCYGDGVLAVVLTGMGQDGMEGCRDIKDAGGQVIAQDKATSVVWGMPGAVATAGLADAVLPISEIGGEILRRVTAARK